ncbi:MAG: tRNA (adenosine(37)-N6)-dimethylallyltransferase MiaA [Myxococcales bacterium]|nr:tRNA (adenosine(37)-N6)-dimethylallyltransferase MiaA [Myxococcales bacterium]
MTRLLVIAGPTASGKTAAALTLARALDGELVGADSVQVYRGFDVGSAKPTAEELGGVPHHLLDVLDPDGFIDAVIYAQLADDAIAEIAARGRLPIVVGGTGLWIRALVRGLLDVPAPDPVIRASLEAEIDRRGSPALHARLTEVDPLAAAAIHENDAFRIVRALEIFKQTGVPAGALRAAHALGAPRYETFFATLELDAAELLPRIEARTDAMLAAGWVDEVRGLLARWPRGARAFGSVGYRQLVEHLCDGVPMDETRRRIVKATRVYARRQRTWFAGEASVEGHPGCVDWRGRPDALVDEPALEALRRWRER